MNSGSFAQSLCRPPKRGNDCFLLLGQSHAVKVVQTLDIVVVAVVVDCNLRDASRTSIVRCLGGAVEVGLRRARGGTLVLLVREFVRFPLEVAGRSTTEAGTVRPRGVSRRLSPLLIPASPRSSVAAVLRPPTCWILVEVRCCRCDSTVVAGRVLEEESRPVASAPWLGKPAEVDPVGAVADGVGSEHRMNSPYALTGEVGNWSPPATIAQRVAVGGVSSEW
eukprot:tig00020801_g13881.t1